MSLDAIDLWHIRARPAPTAKEFGVQLGCHVEEFVEMLESLHFTHDRTVMRHGSELTLLTFLNELAISLKSGRSTAIISNRKEFLDSLADQIVTAVGVGHCAEMNVPGAVKEVTSSNWSKFNDDGQPIFDSNGKITKGPNYRKPDLEGYY